MIHICLHTFVFDVFKGKMLHRLIHSSNLLKLTLQMLVFPSFFVVLVLVFGFGAMSHGAQSLFFFCHLLWNFCVCILLPTACKSPNRHQIFCKTEYSVFSHLCSGLSYGVQHNIMTYSTMFNVNDP